MIQLSILVAAYNVELFIEKCIRSCTQQNTPLWRYEIIVINDGSADRTSRILEDMETPNLKIINQENTGLGAARNTGIENARGAYLWMIDGDDFLEENILPDIFQILTLLQPDALCLQYNIAGENRNIPARTQNLPGNGELLSGPAFYAKNLDAGYTWSFIFKKNLFEGPPLRFQKRINMQDAEILPKIMHRCKTVAGLGKVAYHYVQHPASFTNTHQPERRLAYYHSLIEVRNSLEIFADSLHDDDRLLESAVRKKIEILHSVAFSHLVFYRYDRKTFAKIIALLKANNMYPLKAKLKGKRCLVRVGLNYLPLTTNGLLNIRKKLKS